MAYSVPPLPYGFDALEPHIDAQTMEIHHDKHHAAYVNNLNAALEGTEWMDRPIDAVEMPEYLVPLGDIPLVEAIVRLHRRPRDAVEL